jgi:spermidine synthase
MSDRESPPAKHDRLLLLAFVLSGAAGLGYEILWTRLLALALGSESLGFLGVLGGFFAGLALGSWLLHTRAKTCRDPVRLFAVLECGAALYAAASPYFLHWLAQTLPPLLGSSAGDNDTFFALSISLLIAGVALLPGTICMGATIAALV